MTLQKFIEEAQQLQTGLPDNVEVLQEAKRRVQSVLDVFKKLEKKTKKTKQSRKMTKLMEEFIRCNITNPVIVEKYKRIVAVLAQYYNPQKVEDDSQG